MNKLLVQECSCFANNIIEVIYIHCKFKELPDDEKPRERLIRYGAASLSDSQLLAIVLRNGCHNKNVYDLALEILQNFPLSEIRNCSFYDFISIKGVGEVKALEILAVIELGKRIFLRKKETLVGLKRPEEIWNDIRYFISNAKQEYFYCYYFNQKQELLERKLLFMGTVNRSIVHPREIFKEAYKLSASSIVCVHNHPSNCVTPSKEDVLLTDHLVKAGHIQGIPIRDHIIVGEFSYYSFFEHHNILNL